MIVERFPFDRFGPMIVPVTLVLGVALLALVVPASVHAADTPAIVVNGESVPMDVYRRKLDSWMKQIRKRRRKQSSSTSDSQSSSRELHQHTRDELVKRLVNRLVIETHAKQASIRVSQKEIDREWNKMAERYGGKEQLKKAIHKKKKTVQQVRNQLKLAIKVEKYIARETPEYNPNEEELRSYYNDHPVQFKGKDFEEVKPFIRKTLRKQNKHESLVKLIKKLRKQSDVRINV